MYYSKQHKQRSQLETVYKYSLITGILILIVAYPLALILPVSISFENGFLENLQVLILIVGSLYNLKLIADSIDKEIGAFHLWSAVFMIFMAFRELSWGRVFFPIDMEDNGPVFVAMKNFSLRIEVHIMIALFILFLILFMLKYLPLIRIFNCHLPFLIILAMIISIIFSYVGDHGMLIGKLQGQIVEEIGELAFYILILPLCIHYHKELSRY
ncbi:MAG: hypothetical protein IJ728_01740 [Selenomonadaceae bacterium]|nr:hypothetical protein [Selenomonadaceae bacterium]